MPNRTALPNWLWLPIVEGTSSSRLLSGGADGARVEVRWPVQGCVWMSKVRGCDDSVAPYMRGTLFAIEGHDAQDVEEGIALYRSAEVGVAKLTTLAGLTVCQVDMSGQRVRQR